MLDPIPVTQRFVSSLQSRGVQLERIDGKLRCRGKITPDERETLTRNAQIVEVLIWAGDETLPNVLVVPSACPNMLEAIDACIDAQRRRRAA